MKFYDQAKPGRTIVVRLNPGDYVMESLRLVIDQADLKNGYIASGIASFDHCRLKTAINVSQPPVFVYPEWNDVPLEVVALQGFIAEGQPHVHVVVSDDKQAVAGHLEESRILFVGEIVIQELVGQEFTREPISASLNQIVAKNEEPEKS
jgi:predicted DNA-binding protein with PD1-like motif